MALDYRMGLDKYNQPIIGSKWEYLDNGRQVIVKEVQGNKVMCECGWRGSLDLFQAEGRLYQLLEVPPVGGTMQLGLDAEGKPLRDSTWAATINNTHKDVFRIVGFAGPDVQLELIERDGQKRNETSHIWPIKNFVLQYGKNLKLLSLPGEEMATLQPVAKPKELERKLGIDKEGKPIIGSIWDGSTAESWAPTEVYRIYAIQGELANLRKVPCGSVGSWNWKRIVSAWKLVSIPTPVDPDAIPVLKKKERQNPLEWEKVMQKAELEGNFAGAKQYAQALPTAHKTHNAYLAEENAVAEKRVIREVQLKKLDTGDRKLLEAKVKPFILYAEQMTGWLWFE